MDKKLFYRTERDVTFEVSDTTRYIKVTVTDYGSNDTTFYLSEDQIQEVAQEVDKARLRRINKQLNR